MNLKISTMTILPLLVIVATLGCVNQKSTLEPSPKFDLTAEISGNTLKITVNRISDLTPNSLWIQLQHHPDISISGPNLKSGRVTLNPSQARQGDDYTILGGRQGVKTYVIGVILYYEYGGAHTEVKRKNLMFNYFGEY